MTDSHGPSIERRRPDWAALCIMPLLVGLGGFIAWDASHLATARGYDPVGPAMISYIVAGGLALLGLLSGIAAWRGQYPEREKQEMAPVLFIVLGLVIQLVTIRFVGFSIATGLLFAATAFAFGQRKIWLSLPVGFILALLVWFVFARLLQLTLPTGPIEFGFAQGAESVIRDVVRMFNSIVPGRGTA